MTSTRATFARHERRPRWWSAFLSLLVALALVAQPACLCAAAEGAHHHGGAAQHPAHHDENAHADEDAATHRDHRHSHVSHGDVSHHENSHGDDSHAASTRATLSEPHQSHVCCCEYSQPPLVAVAPSRLAVPHDSNAPLFAPATLPVAPDVFALTNCHGRDGPTPDAPLRTQFFAFPFSGRAPPIFA